MSVRWRSAPPRAAAMLESLRGLGYSTGAALADLIDNSISAGAADVSVRFRWMGDQSSILVLDNGSGMTEPELERAMRLGGISPLDPRRPQDLGRFGMGLKTASLSQCRRVTVASRKAGAESCLRWDLDELVSAGGDEWILFEGPAAGSEHTTEGLRDSSSGTVVVWERLDRIVVPGFSADDFNDLIDSVEGHLAMVFHRLIGGTTPRFRLWLNGHPVRPWDPFMTGHPGKSWTSPLVNHETPAGPVQLECHVLPHKDRLTVAEHDAAAGPEGWTAQQGFYVYRNERLLHAGGWIGLGQPRPWTRDESHRLARIRLDIPNTADADWKIDIRKSIARPPVSIRPWLTRYAEDTRARARKVFAYRGAPTPGPGREQVQAVWHAEQRSAHVRYRIDEAHPVVAAVFDRATEWKPLLRSMLRVIEETVPVQRIWLDTAENRETPETGFSGEPPENVREVMRTLFDDLVGRRSMSVAAARRVLEMTEPFQKYPQLIASLGDDD